MFQNQWNNSVHKYTIYIVPDNRKYPGYGSFTQTETHKAYSI